MFDWPVASGQLVASIGLWISRVGWGCALLLFALQATTPSLRRVVQFGKTARSSPAQQGGGLLARLLCTPVLSCRALWTSVYAWSLCWLLATGAAYLWLDAAVDLQLGTLRSRSASLLAAALLACQLLRRVVECLFVHNFHPSRAMNMLQWFLAVGFYMCASLSLAFEPSLPLDALGSGRLVAGLTAFLVASAVQSWAHLVLARLPAPVDPATGRKRYAVPRAACFALVSAPHYLAEIVVYLSLFTFCAPTNYSMILVFVFVCANLALAAQQNHRWYLDNFRDYPTSRRQLIPFIW